MSHFEHLRRVPWHPSFEWLATLEEAGLQINSFHEDYPEHVRATTDVLRAFDKHGLWTTPAPTSELLLGIHAFVFKGHKFGGKLRTTKVRVGTHIAPPPADVPILMSQLQGYYPSFEAVSDGLKLEALKAWYYDFETIHPYRDGNGRVGGIIVAAYSHALVPASGWYTVKQ